MKTERVGRWLSSPLLLVCILAVFYTNTMAPDITWANSGYDGGDFITAAATGGVAHPSGYPTYLILAKFFQLLPFGTLALRTHLMSAFSASLAAFVISDLVRRSLKESYFIRRWAAFLAGLGFGLSSLLWSQAVITEVYTLNSLFVALILWVMFLNEEVSPMKQVWLDRIGGLIFGLALGNQITILFLLPPWLGLGLFDRNSTNSIEEINTEKKRLPVWQALKVLTTRLNAFALLRRFGWLCLGLLVYLALPFWARSESPVNWGNPVDIEGFWWLVSGQLYQNMVFSLSPDFIGPRLGLWFKLLKSQYSLMGALVGLLGLVLSWNSKRFFWITSYIFLVYTFFSVGYNTGDSYILLIPSFLVLGLWFGKGVSVLLEKTSETSWRNWLTPISAVVFLVLLLVNARINYPKVDASQDNAATAFGDRVLLELPQDAIVITKENKDTFTLWYYHFALGQRPDIAVINSGSLAYDWYRDRMQLIYPDLILSDPAGCYPCMIDDLSTFNHRPICETSVNTPAPLYCRP